MTVIKKFGSPVVVLMFGAGAIVYYLRWKDESLAWSSTNHSMQVVSVPSAEDETDDRNATVSSM